MSWALNLLLLLKNPGTIFPNLSDFALCMPVPVYKRMRNTGVISYNNGDTGNLVPEIECKSSSRSVLQTPVQLEAGYNLRCSTIYVE